MREVIDKTRYDEISRLIRNAANNARERPATAIAQALIALATTVLEDTVDHEECIRAEDGNPRAHRHEAQVGRWLWPDEAGKGLYDDSPTGA